MNVSIHVKRSSSSSSSDDSMDSTLLARVNLLTDGLHVQVCKQRSHPSRSRKHALMPSLNIVPGCMILVLDTNVILSSLSAVPFIIDSLRWTIVVPVPCHNGTLHPPPLAVYALAQATSMTLRISLLEHNPLLK